MGQMGEICEIGDLFSEPAHDEEENPLAERAIELARMHEDAEVLLRQRASDAEAIIEKNYVFMWRSMSSHWKAMGATVETVCLTLTKWMQEMSECSTNVLADDNLRASSRTHAAAVQQVLLEWQQNLVPAVPDIMFMHMHEATDAMLDFMQRLLEMLTNKRAEDCTHEGDDMCVAKCMFMTRLCAKQHHQLLKERKFTDQMAKDVLDGEAEALLAKMEAKMETLKAPSPRVQQLQAEVARLQPMEAEVARLQPMEAEVARLQPMEVEVARLQARIQELERDAADHENELEGRMIEIMSSMQKRKQSKGGGEGSPGGH